MQNSAILYLKFLIDAHLVLGVHDVESLVIGFQPGCEFTGVGKTAVSLLAFLGLITNTLTMALAL